jgi:predicted DNA-binding transcriptional regulator AlpA
MATHITRRFLGTKEAAAYLQITPRTLQNLRSAGKGPTYVRLSERNIRYKAEDLDDYVQKMTITEKTSGPGE